MNLGAAYVDLLPDMGRFLPELRAEMTQIIRQANIDVPVHGDTRKLSGDVEKASDKAGRAGGKRLGSGLAAGIKFGLAGLAVGVGAAAAAGLKGAISAGSDLQETMSKSATIFGKNADAIKSFSKNSARDFGISRQAALETTAQYGNMFQQIGIGGREALEMSKGYVQLSTDLASFNNADPAAVTDALLSAQRGEYDALQRYIPTVNAAKVEAEALRQTHKKSAKTLTDAEKATALYSIAQKGAGAAAGDFKRTQNGAANQQRILNAQIEDGKAKLGSSLTPAYAAVLKLLNNKVIPGFDKVKGAVTGMWESFKDSGNLDLLMAGVYTVQGAFYDLKIVFYDVQSAVYDFWDSFKASGNLDLLIAGVYTVQGYLYGLQARFYELQIAAMPVFERISAFVVGRVIPAFGALARFIVGEIIPRFAAIGAAVGGLLRVVIPIVMQIVGTIVKTFRDNEPVIRGIFENIKGIITGAMDFVQALISRVTKIIKAIWSVFGGTILSVIRTVFTTIIGVIKGALGIIKNVIKLATSILRGDWSGAWSAIKGILRGAWDIIKAVVKGAIGIVRATFWAGIQYLIGKAGDLVAYIGGKFKTGFNVVKEAILAPIRSAKEKLAEMLGAGKNGMQTLFSTAVSKISSALNKIKSKAAEPINFVIREVYNNGIRKALNLIPGVNFGEASEIKYATGGVLPGHTPGRDVHHFVSPTGGKLALSGGEAIMRPEWTKAVGGAGAVAEMNMRARRGQAFASGGVFAGGRQVVPGSGNRHGSGYPWARWAGDFPNPTGTPVYAWKDGVVNSVKHLTTSYGKHIRAQYGKTEMLIAHLSKTLVGGGDRLRQGQKIGEVGSTGNSTGPHAHVEFRGGIGKIIGGLVGGGAGVTEKLMSWLGSPTEKILSGLGDKMTKGISKVPFGPEAISAGKAGISSAIKYAKAAPEAGWNKAVQVFDSAKGAVRDYLSGKGETGRNAATIASVGSGMGKRAQTIGIATSIVESGLRNLKYGDRDSVGLFQQRAPWGSFADRTNPRKSAGMFFHGGRGGQRGLDDIPGWRNMNMGRAAQAVQVSAFPGRYAQEMNKASGILASLKYADGGVMPALARGGIVRARRGGTVVRVGEGGRDEAVIPLPKSSDTQTRTQMSQSRTVYLTLDLGRGISERVRIELDDEGEFSATMNRTGRGR